MKVGQKIKSLRERKGYAQQELADKAGVSIRTIQRIEKGENEPQGFTLRSICEALGFPPENLFDEHLVEDNGMIQALHLMSMVGLLFPLGNVVAPAIYWLSNKNKFKKLDLIAKNLLFWQIIGTSLAFIMVIFSMLSKLTHTDIGLGITQESFIIGGLIIHYLILSMFLPILFCLLTRFWKVKTYYPRIFKK